MIAVAAAFTVGACVRESVQPSDALYAAEGIEVYTDSIVIDGHSHTALNRYEITNAWQGVCDTSMTPNVPVLYSGSRMAEAIYTKSATEYAASSLTPLDIWLTGALLEPERSMETLRSMVSDGVIHRHGYPITADKEAWAAAAWEVYCATGSEEWLREAYRVIHTTYRREMPTLRAEGGLLYGAPSYMTPGKEYFPAWMGTVDRYQTIAAGTNAWHYATLTTLTRMARQLRLYAEREWEKDAAEVRNAINDAFWVPARSCYGQYLYGDLYPILSPSADNRAGALCILLDIATRGMAERMMATEVMLADGIPTIYPPAPGAHPDINPEVQALCGIAAARTGNEKTLLGTAASLWRLALDDRNRAGWQALVLRGLLGLTLSPDGLTIAPVIPSGLGSYLRLDGLTYRDATLDIRVSGTGDKIASLSVDSVRHTGNTLPPDMHGHHTVDITMSGNRLADSQTPVTPTVTDPAHMPATPRLYWDGDSRCKILNFDPAMTYEAYLNGILSQTLSTPTYEVTDTGTTVVDIVTLSDSHSGFAPRSHVCAPSSSVIHIPATAITPRRPPLNLIRNPELASRYIELAARHNTRLTFYVQAPAEGEYFFNIAYANGTTETATRTVEVNNSHAGVIVCPDITHNDWVTTRTSSTITVRLHSGVNKLSLTYVDHTILLHDIYLLKK